MTGQIIKLRAGYEWKDGKITRKYKFRDASHAIRAKKSKRVCVVKKGSP